MADTDYLAASDGTGDAALMHITTPRTALATIIQVDTVSGVPAFFIGTWGTLLASGFIDPATKRDFFGHVNAGTLVIDKMAPGNTDGGNTTGQVVVIKPSTPTQNLVGNFVKTSLNNFGEGVLLNGKIVPSISTNNLVVAIKTLNGVDPSSTDVVYVRIGNTIRSITAPLSVTLAAGTNWFSKGASYFAAAESDFFVYLGYNTTDGVTIGVSSIPNALRYSDFSTTNTNWNYAKISTITNAAAADVYENIGRFNAILGVSATYLWTLPATQIIINQPTFETRIFNATNTGTAGGTIWWKQTRDKKEAWGQTASKTNGANTSSNYGVTFPAGFFSGIGTMVTNIFTASGSVTGNVVIGVGVDVTGVTLGFANTTASAGIGGVAGYSVIGT
jgi:hypothetical protein